MIKFTNDAVAMDEGGDTCGGLVHPSKFTPFVMLKIVVCICSDCVENVFRVRSLGWRRWDSDVDIYTNGGVGAEVGGSWVR